LMASFVAIPSTGWARSFSVAVHVIGNDQPTVLATAIRGMRLAATKKHGQSDRTSDGHLGGLDHFILSRPGGDLHGIKWLKGAQPGEADI
jgi:hypothetical protein